MAAGTYTGTDQDRHVMSRTRRRANRNADPTRWSRTSNDTARPKALNARPSRPEMEPRERLHIFRYAPQRPNSTPP